MASTFAESDASGSIELPQTLKMRALMTISGQIVDDDRWTETFSSKGRFCIGWFQPFTEVAR